MRVLIAGGGVAALEALLALSDVGAGHVEIEVLAPRRELTYRPMAIAEAFGLATPRHVDLADAAARHRAKFRTGALDRVFDRVAISADGQRIPFDFLLLAIGCRPIAGLPRACTFAGPDGVGAFRDVLDRLRSGETRSVAFTLPARARWSLALYELGLMTAAYAARHGVRAELHIVTPERRALEVFGDEVSDHVEALLEDAGVQLHTRATPLAVHTGRLITTPAQSIRADEVVALPRLRPPHIGGIPHNAEGFVPVDRFSRVNGLTRVYAAGDITSYPVKQGGLAAQQADAAAMSIAAAAGAPATPRPFQPVLRAALLTGDAPHYIRSAHGRAPAISPNALWWPPEKTAGRYLAAFLAGDEQAVPLRDVTSDHHPALDLALAAADAAAGWGDYDDALRWLGVAERLNIALTPGWASKRSEWQDMRERHVVAH